MDESVFQALLARFPVVRSRDTVLPPQPEAHVARTTPAIAAPPRASAATAAAAAAASGTSARVQPPRDFWTGLEAFLLAH
jgi:hypothetical protein